jgi:hypothetical protein
MLRTYGELPMSDTSVLDPSPKRVNGDSAEPAAAGNDRDRRGRFSKGNAGGHGNPFGRQVAALRADLLACANKQDIQDVMAALLLQAKKGNVAAARLYLGYTVGKPAETVDPDRVTIDEWQITQESGARVEAVAGVLNTMPVEMASNLVQATQPAIGAGMAEHLTARLKAVDEAERRRADRKRRKQERKQARLARRQQKVAGRMGVADVVCVPANVRARSLATSATTVRELARVPANVPARSLATSATSGAEVATVSAEPHPTPTVLDGDGAARLAAPTGAATLPGRAGG